MADRHGAEVDRLQRAVLDGKGELAPALRRAAFAGEVPDNARAYVAKVRQHAYRVTDEDIAALRAADYSEDQIFELTVSAALGAALHRRDVGLRALRGGK